MALVRSVRQQLQHFDDLDLKAHSTKKNSDSKAQQHQLSVQQLPYQDLSVQHSTQKFNMVLRQCLACNAMMTESCRSCTCGHVFEDAKQIGGKRFSEYRAKLYTRLENKRQKQLTRRKRKENETETGPEPLKERKTNIEESTVPPAGFQPKTHSSFGSKPFPRRIKGKRISRPLSKPPAPRTTVVPPELVSRLPSALQEINRRLTGQNLMWWIMQLQ